MKGVIFNILEDFIITNWGAETYEEIFAMCPLHTRDGYVGPETYPDADLTSLVAATCDRLGVEPRVAIESFGEFMFPQLAARYPVFLEGHDEPISFLKTVDEVIHVEVRKLMRDTKLPEMSFIVDPDTGDLVVNYRSERKLCALLKGLLTGVQRHFGTDMPVSEHQCMHDGDDSCVFRVHSTERVAQSV